MLVGNAKKKRRLISMPMNFTLMAPELLYECSSPILNEGPFHLSSASWTVICKYAPHVVPEHCSVSVSSFNRKTETSAVCLSEPQMPSPIKMLWHIKTNRNTELEVLIKVTNRGVRTFSNWNLYLCHSYVNNLTTVEGLNSKISGNAILLWGKGIFKNEVVAKLHFKAISAKRDQGAYIPQIAAWNGDTCAIPSAEEFGPLYHTRDLN